MTFTWPVGLILIVPLVLLFWWARIPRRAFTPFRVMTLVLLLLAIGGLSIRLPGRSGCVVVVADRSLSMPPGSDTQQGEIVNLVSRSMGPRDELAVISFGQRVSIDQPPQQGRFRGFTQEVGRESSHLGEALDRAVSLISRDRPGRILVLSDGQATGTDVAAAAARAAAAGVAVDYRSMFRSGASDLAVERVDAPDSVGAAEAFMISAWISSPRPQDIAYELRHGETILKAGEISVSAGRTRLMFRDKAGDAGSRSYELKIRSLTSPEDDPVQENNLARFLIGVRGAKPLLCMSPAESKLPNLLAAGGVKLDRRRPEQFQWTLAELAGYSGVLLEDIPAGQVGTVGLETLSAWVTQAGGGLMTTGGRNSYGSGGYFKSRLEPIMPVSMEMRKEHRKLSLAIVVALDRSGSMAMTVPGGRAKMDLANAATVEVLNQLSGVDQFGCLAVDSMAHEIVPLSDMTNRGSMEEQILKIDSLGGGIFVYEALEKAAAMIATATAGTRHIILFSDAADSEEPGDYQRLLETVTKAGITVSVIGLGTEHDTDAALLQDIARRGGGQCMFTEDAHELPRLFAQDTFLISRSTFIEDPTTVHPTAAMKMISPQSWGDLPQVGGYNLCYLRPGATLGIVTEDEYKAPLVASWQAGTGRVLSYTGQADGEFTGPIGKWPQSGEFFSALARWIGAQEQGLGSDLLLTQQLRGSHSRVQLHLDHERTSTPFSSLPELTVLRARDGQPPEAERLPLNWEMADTLSAEVPLFGEQTLLTSLEIPGVGQTTLPPLRLPYSAEFAVHPVGEGERTLERMARTTGGIERVNLASIWADLPQSPHLVSLAPWLLLLALPFLLMEVLQRRTGLLTLPRRSRSRETDESAVSTGSAKSPASAGRRKKQVFRTSTGSSAAVASTTKSGNATDSPADGPTGHSPASPPAAPQKFGGDVGDALSQARNRAARRTQRE